MYVKQSLSHGEKYVYVGNVDTTLIGSMVPARDMYTRLFLTVMLSRGVPNEEVSMCA